MSKKLNVLILIGAVVLLGAFFVFLGMRLTISGSMPKAAFKLYDRGSEKIIQYEKYGQFVNQGKPDYKYLVKNRKALMNAAGEGVFPSNAVYQDPLYKELSKEKKLNGSHWDFLSLNEPVLVFYKWA
ncbi:MAG: hypothetical protein HQ579_05475, partial [Candidatus Omnitrophica bacterium]|nr:hypothetical protein [Candidatus Omnitrophota bacterium]